MDSVSFPACIPAEKGFVHFFGTRQGPVALIDRVQPGQATPVPPDYPTVVSLKQVHGKHVVVFDDPSGLTTLCAQEGDGLMTHLPQVLLVVRTADCVPVLIADIEHGVVAAVHAGWRGAVAGVVPETLSVMQRHYGTTVDHIRVAIGPSIGRCCFQVDDPVIGPLKERFPFWADVLSPISSTHANLDLKAFVKYQLRHLGVIDTSMQMSAECTQCDAARFYSYRREGKVNGTMVSGIMIKRSLDTCADSKV